jgi:hypothetical protein
VTAAGTAVRGVVSRSKGAPVTLEEIVVPAPGPGEAVVDVKTCGSGGLRRLELASRVRRVPGLPAGAALVQGVKNASKGATEKMDLKPGTRWSSQVCDTEVIVVRAPQAPVSLECGGHPMAPIGADRTASLGLDPSFAAGSVIGKRFADSESGLELLVTKAGEGSLAVDGITIPLKVAKPLPASD